MGALSGTPPIDDAALRPAIDPDAQNCLLRHGLSKR